MPSLLVVIVDDSITNLKIVERLTLSLGVPATARCFTDPAAALLFCVDHRPDLVLVAACGGLGEAAEFIVPLQRLADGAEVPVIVVGSIRDLDSIERARALGAADHVLLPVDPQEFRIRVQGQLRPRQPTAERPYPEGAKQAYETLLRLIDVIPRMICVTARDGRYLLVNRMFTSFVGMPGSRLVGKRPAEAHGGLLARILMEGDERLFSGRGLLAPAEDEIVDRHGNPCVLLSTKALFDAGEGDEAMVITVFVDITERKRAERELIAAKERADLGNRGKTEFVTNMSHELRTPLNAIIGFSQVIAGEMLGPIGTAKYVGYARDVLTSAEHLLGLINDILDVSKLESGKLDLAEEIIDPGKTVTDVLQLTEAKARAGDISVVVRREGVIHPLLADPRKLKQVVLNLLGNAIKFSHPGGRVEIVLRNVADALSIAVIDHGIGMDSAEVQLAMTRFGQVASTWTRKHDGTGLGLPLAIGLTELHGGELAIHSTKGIGTTVTVTLPRERSRPDPDSPGRALRAVAHS